MLWNAEHPLELDNPQVCLVGHDHGAALYEGGEHPTRSWTNPLHALEWLADSWSAGAIPRKHPWIGYLSYDLGRCFERLPVIAKDRLGTPLFIFGHSPAGPDARARGSWIAARSSALTSTFSRDAYTQAVQRAINYIAAGDVFQVNLSQMFTAPARQRSREIFQRLHEAAPAPYGAFLSFDEIDLISNSPELFLRVTPDRRVITRPIKGTRPRGPGMQEQLRDSVKDQAELNMIVDLERNDLGRVCEIGSVRVTEPRVIEAHPTVYHGVATIEGTLRSNVTFLDLLRATFPGGSVTGAPKIRAMEIIEALEPIRRGPYCGAIGYLAEDGSMEFNVAIRTMIA
jgi:anthranilate/para-aminobenzoate synthase component I